MRAHDYALKMNEWLIYQKNTKKSISTHLDFIAKRIHAEHSTLDHLATWYGEKSRLMQWLESAVILGTATLMGAIAGHAIFFSLIATLIYIPFVAFLSAHNTALMKKKQTLEANLTNIKQDQSEAIAEINTLDEKINAVVADTKEQLETLVQETTLIQEQTAEVAFEAALLMKSEEHIHTAGAALIECTETLNVTLEHATSAFDACQTALVEELSELKQAHSAVTSTTLALDETQCKLAEINRTFAETQEQLSFFSKSAQRALDTMTATPPQTLERPIARAENLLELANAAIKRHDDTLATTTEHSKELSQQAQLQIEEGDRPERARGNETNS